jgi:hypothetical protein
VQVLDLEEAEEWIRAHVDPVGPPELEHDRPWSTVFSVPLADGVAWFKECGPVQAFEPRLSAELFARSPNLVAEVLAHDEERAWLLLADAGAPIGPSGNLPDALLTALPPYAELQRGEIAYAHEHLAHHVPDLRMETLPSRFEQSLQSDLPLDDDEIDRLRTFAPQLAELCAELAAYGVGDTVQHDDLHFANLYEKDGRLRVLDWGDSSISHPFASLYTPYRFLENVTKLPPGDPWFARLRDAYLEPWGEDHEDAFALGLRVGAFAHATAWTRQRDHLPQEERPEFDLYFPEVLRRALARTVE